MPFNQQFNQANRTDYTFTWEKEAGFADGKFVIQVFVQGNQIGGYNYLFNLPEDVEQRVSERATTSTFLSLLQFIGLIAIFLFVLILFLKKYHEGEVSTSLGLTLFIVVFFSSDIYSKNNKRNLAKRDKEIALQSKEDDGNTEFSFPLRNFNSALGSSSKTLVSMIYCF